MTFYGRRNSEDYQPFKFPILCIVIITQSNARQTAVKHAGKHFLVKMKFRSNLACFVWKTPARGTFDGEISRAKGIIFTKIGLAKRYI